MTQALHMWLGIPWEEQNCLQISLAYLRSVQGWPIPECPALTEQQVDRGFLDLWVALPPGEAPQAYDLMVVPGEANRLHVGVVLEGCKQVLSSYRERGSMVVSIRSFCKRGVLPGVWRWRR